MPMMALSMPLGGRAGALCGEAGPFATSTGTMFVTKTVTATATVAVVMTATVAVVMTATAEAGNTTATTMDGTGRRTRRMVWLLGAITVVLIHVVVAGGLVPEVEAVRQTGRCALDNAKKRKGSKGSAPEKSRYSEWRASLGINLAWLDWASERKPHSFMHSCDFVNFTVHCGAPSCCVFWSFVCTPIICIMHMKLHL